MATALQAVRGMNDVLPDEAALWEYFEDTTRDVFRRYGYRNLRVPIVEPTPLFVRAIGEVTDVVEKEMYTFADKLNGDSLTLRPEATAGIVRAAIEHNLTLRPAAARVARGPDVPPRAAAERPLSPVPPVRRRGAGLPRARRRRRADGDARATLEGARPGRRHPSWRSTRSATRRSASRTAQRSSSISRGTPMRSTRIRSGGCTRIRCASSTARTPRCSR